MYPELHFLIGGQPVAANGRQSLDVFNPATGKTLGLLPIATNEDLNNALKHAESGFNLWRKSTPEQRANILRNAADLLDERIEDLAKLATLEVGKTLAESRIEVGMNSKLFRFYAGECERLYGRLITRPDGRISMTKKVPVGPIAAFASWNFPLGNPGRKLAAPIAAGCSVILKAGEEAPASALAVLKCLLDAGLPGDVAQLVFGDPDHISKYLLESPIIRKVSFTGSTIIGKHLTKLAAEDMKLTTMELGGHAPVIVCNDADIKTLVTTMVRHKYRNAGQVCVASTRFLVERGVAEEFIQSFVEQTKSLKVGNGLDETVDMGPMVHDRGRQRIAMYVEDAIKKGATLACGGHSIEGKGFFFEPTVLCHVPENAILMNEEPFGPVAIINIFDNDEEAIAESNRLPYGLAAFIWTANTKRHRHFSESLNAGMIGVNTVVIGDADSPFCGVKWSGHGAENGPEGLAACLVTKTIHEAY